MLAEMIMGFFLFSLVFISGLAIPFVVFIIMNEKRCPEEECNRTEKRSVFCRKCGKKLIHSDHTKRLIKWLR